MVGYEGLFQELEARGVRYVVVGGLAVVLRGYVRATIDLDLVTDLESGNVLRLVDGLTCAGFVPSAPVAPESLADPAVRARWIEEKNARVLSWHHLSEPLLVVDVFLTEPLPFDRVWSRADRLPYRRARVPVAATEELIELKRRAGRPQDLIDIEHLQALERRPNGDK